MMYRLHTKKNSSANYSRHLSRKFSLTKRGITHWRFKRCLLWTQIRLNAVEVMRLLHNTLTLKEAEVALNTDIYHWTWPHKWLRLTVSPDEVLLFKLPALRVYHVDIKHRDLYMTSKITGGSFFLQNPLKYSPAFLIFASLSTFLLPNASKSFRFFNWL